MTSAGTLLAAAQDKDYTQQLGPQLRALADAIGQLRISGLAISAHGANLSFNISAGVMFDFGVNGVTNPHQISIGAKTPATFQYILRSGSSIAPDRTTLDPTQYDNNGVLTTLTNNRFALHDVFIFSSGNVRVQYGQNQFTSLDAAVASVGTRQYVINPALGLGLRIGSIAVKKEATSLAVTTDATFIQANRFGEF